MRPALGEMNDALERILSRHVLAAARRFAAAASRASKGARAAHLSRSHIRTRVKRRALRMTRASRLRCARCVDGHRSYQVLHVRHIDGIRHLDATTALQIKQARLLFGIGKAIIQRYKRKPAVRRRQ